MSPRYFQFPAQFADSNAKPEATTLKAQSSSHLTDRKPEIPAWTLSGRNSNSRQDVVNGNPATFRVKHRDPYSDAAKFSDPADWDNDCVEPNQIHEIEPLPEVQSDYRIAALTHMATLKAIDLFMSTASDPRLAWTTVSARVQFDFGPRFILGRNCQPTRHKPANGEPRNG